jgi:NAD(P)-dependent dehydrogenase (short-subunit alcohol dehydrogenase family)
MSTGTIIVSGGLGALGRVVVRALLEAGYSTICLDASKDAARDHAVKERVVDEIDLSDARAVETAVRQILAEREDVVGLVNLVGAFRDGSLQSTSPDTLDLVFNSNVKSCFNLCKAVGPRLQKGGRILNVGALAVGKGLPGMAAYTMAKAALMEMTQCYATELRESGVTVNAILPSTIDTPQNRLDMPDADPSKWIRPEAIADVLLFLLSPNAKCVTGALIPVSNNAL